jgi:hypothetical protein
VLCSCYLLGNARSIKLFGNGVSTELSLINNNSNSVLQEIIKYSTIFRRHVMIVCTLQR